MNSHSSQKTTWFRFLTILLLLTAAFADVHPVHALGGTYTVTTLMDNTTDDAFCSIREAMDAANNMPDNANCGAGSTGNDVINFSVSGTIYLNGALYVNSGSGSLTLNGNGIYLSGDTNHDGTRNISVMTVAGNATLLMDNVNIVFAYGPGLTILGGGSATVTNSAFVDNQNPFGGGGGIENAGTLNVTNTDFQYNITSSTAPIPISSGGGILNSPGGNATITSSTFIGNESGLWGGGLYNASGATLNLGNSYFYDNVASNGGGVFSAGTATLTEVVFDTNVATNGGGMYTYQSSPTLTDVTILWNLAASGGGMYNDQASPNLTNVTFRENAASGSGGGMTNFSGSNPTLINVTFSGNSASLNGGGMFNSSSSPFLTAATFSLNTAGNFGGGIYNTNSSGTILRNTLIANSTNGDCYGLIDTASSINNLTEDAGPFFSCGLTHGTNDNIIGQGDPKLGILQNNGGLTDTIKPFPSSPVINAGNSAGACPSTDQRGTLRPQGASCDIGALEFAPTFSDVPMNYWAWRYIESLYANNITGGCSAAPLNYCPNTNVTRAQMAVFLLKGIHGAAYTPPAATGAVFGDVSAGYWAAAWIEQLSVEGITGGCGSGNFCPDAVVTRGQMAVFLLRAKHGGAYLPPAASGIFTDVPVEYWAAAWIEQLAAEGITGGCGGSNYCPATIVNRGQMAVFLVATFALP